MMHSYVFAYYIHKDNMSEMFEENQAFLHSNVEKLSAFLEREVHLLSDRQKRIDMNNLVAVCENFSKQLIEMVQEGKLKKKWNFRNI